MTQDVIRKTDKWIPWYFVAFFVALAIIDGIFVTIALSTHTGVVSERAYQDGVEYNKTIEAAESQEKLGWQSEVEISGETLNISLKDKNGKAIKDAKVTAYFMRQSQDGYDFSSIIGANAEGMYSKHIDFPLKGLWDVRILATWNQQQYQRSKEIVVK